MKDRWHLFATRVMGIFKNVREEPITEDSAKGVVVPRRKKRRWWRYFFELIFQRLEKARAKKPSCGFTPSVLRRAQLRGVG